MYLSDFELARRQGYKLSIADGIKTYTKSSDPVNEPERLIISTNGDTSNPYDINKQLRSCSIDLHIAGKFLKTQRAKLDILVPCSNNSAKKLWKEIEPKKLNNGIKLKPGQTLLTMTHEKITIPFDCAGKLEIKSTYSRLSLSITFGDFCNPKWSGHFPLLIKNHGKHTIIIRPYTVMAQLSLIKLSNTVERDYTEVHSAFYYPDGDDGLPYGWWREQQIVSLKKVFNVADIENICKYVSEKIDPECIRMRERFQDDFVKYAYRKKKNCSDVKQILRLYLKKERRNIHLSKLFPPTSLVIGFIPILATIVPVLSNPALKLNIYVLIASVLFMLTAGFISYKVNDKQFLNIEIDIDKIKI